MRRVAKTLAITLSLFLLPVGLANGAITGTKCTKTGITKTVSNIKYTCVKQGSKLIWNKGVLIKLSPKVAPTPATSPIPVPVPTQSPTVSPTPTVFPTSTPTPTPSIIYSTAGLTTEIDFNNLYENRLSVGYAAWKKSFEAFNSGKSTLKNVTIFLGPNTKEPKNKNPKLAYANISQLFSGFSTPQNLYVIQYGIKDIQWADDKIKSLVSQKTYEDFVRNEGGHLTDSNCGYDCFGAKQITASDGTAFILQGVAEGSNHDPMEYARLNLGQNDAHEFFHALQRENGAPAGMPVTEWPTSWIIEGGAELAGNLSMSHDSYDEFMKWRLLDSESLKDPVQGITKADLDTFLDLDGNKNYWRTDNQWWAYNLGSRVMEVFVAIKGPGVLLELHKQTVKQGFNQAFTSIFGQSWSSVRPILSKTLYELIKTGN